MHGRRLGARPCCRVTPDVPTPLPPRPLYDFASGLRSLDVRNGSLHLADCANLAVAAAGSSSLTNLLGREVGASLGVSGSARSAPGCPSPGSINNHGVHGAGAASPFTCGHVHHLHQYLPPALHEHGARCIVATLRDPAERLATAFGYELGTFYIGHKQILSLMSMRNSKVGIYQVAEFVNALMAPQNYSAQHKYALHVFNRSVGPSVFAPGLPGGGQESFAGNPFLVPQARYIAAMQEVPGAELHLVCLERFGRDWDRFMDRFAAERPAAERAKAVKTNNGSRAHFGRYGVYLSERQKEWVRDVMFPDDTALWRRVCNSSEGGVT